MKAKVETIHLYCTQGHNRAVKYAPYDRCTTGTK